MPTAVLYLNLLCSSVRHQALRSTKILAGGGQTISLSASDFSNPLFSDSPNKLWIKSNNAIDEVWRYDVDAVIITHTTYCITALDIYRYLVRDF